MTFLYTDEQFLEAIKKLAQDTSTELPKDITTETPQKGYKGEGILGKTEGLQLGKKLIDRLIGDWNVVKKPESTSNQNTSQNSTQKDNKNKTNNEINSNVVNQQTLVQEFTKAIKSPEGQKLIYSITQSFPFVPQKIDTGRISTFMLSLNAFIDFITKNMSHSDEVLQSFNVQGIQGSFLEVQKAIAQYISLTSFKPSISQGIAYQKGEETAFASRVGGSAQFAAKVMEVLKTVVASTTDALQEVNRSDIFRASWQETLQKQIALGQNYEENMESSIYFLQHRTGLT